jgi:hypothetical protein
VAGDTGLINITGEGLYALTTPVGSVDVWAIVVLITSVTNPRVRIIGTVQPRFLQYAGSYGLVLADRMSYFKTLQHEREQIVGVEKVGTGRVSKTADHFLWRLAAGVSGTAQVYWL